MSPAGTPPAEIRHAVVIEEFKPVIKNTLRGFARIRFPSGMVMSEIGLHVANGRGWASPPSRAMVDARTGSVLRDADGKTKWQPLIGFTDKGVRDSWSAQIVRAVHAAYPDALEGLVREDGP